MASLDLLTKMLYVEYQGTSELEKDSKHLFLNVAYKFHVQALSSEIKKK